ncbi:MAG: CoA transferase subunit A [Sporolactobacillus sp.]
MAEILNVQKAAKLIKDGSSLLISGFLGCGAPLLLIDALVENKVKDLTVISPVSALPGCDHDIGKLAINHQIKSFIGSHIGTNKVLSQQYLEGTLDVEFVPQGTLVECIRAYGAGLGAVVTPVGVGTQQEDSHEKIKIDGKDYLIYKPLGADFALLKGNKADKYGNLVAKGSSKSTNLINALAGKTVIAEVEDIVEPGEIDPSDVLVPGILVDYIVQGRTHEEIRTYYTNLWDDLGWLAKEEEQ